MNRTIAIMLIGCLVVSIAGCPINPTQTTIQLVNDGIFPVEVTIYISGTQEIPELLLTTTGTRIERTVQAGQTATIVRDCDDLQAIIIADADLQIIGEIGPSADTDVLRDGSDFNCGDTIRFRFTHPLIPTSLNIATE